MCKSKAEGGRRCIGVSLSPKQRAERAARRRERDRERKQVQNTRKQVEVWNAGVASRRKQVLKPTPHNTYFVAYKVASTLVSGDDKKRELATAICDGAASGDWTNADQMIRQIHGGNRAGGAKNRFLDAMLNTEITASELVYSTSGVAIKFTGALQRGEVVDPEPLKEMVRRVLALPELVYAHTPPTPSEAKELLAEGDYDCSELAQKYEESRGLMDSFRDSGAETRVRRLLDDPTAVCTTDPDYILRDGDGTLFRDMDALRSLRDEESEIKSVISGLITGHGAWDDVYAMTKRGVPLTTAVFMVAKPLANGDTIDVDAAVNAYETVKDMPRELAETLHPEYDWIKL